MPKADWIKIKNEYINTNISQRKLAEKYGISYNTLKDKAHKENWAEQKQKTHIKITSKTHQKTTEKIIDEEVDRISKIYYTSDLLHDKVLESINQLSQNEFNVVDVNNLRKLVASLKDLKDIVNDDISGKGSQDEQYNLLDVISKAVNKE